MKVVIVGGGIAGIKAALVLQCHGVDYEILEAKDRLGGRLQTVQGLNSKYDMGASWYHETLSNALFDEEDAIGSSDKFFDDAPVKIIAHDGPVSGMLKLEPIVNEMYKFCELESYKDLQSDESLHASMVRYLKSKEHLLSDEQILKASQYARKLELWHGIEIRSLSSKDALIDNAGRDALALHYDAMLKRHTDQLNMNLVSLESVVTGITRTNKGRSVIVKTKDHREIEADYAIVCIPQSILQLQQGDEGFISFDPPLPDHILGSLQKVHFGALGKVVLEFDECFWPRDSERILALSSPPEGFLEAVRNGLQVPEHDPYDIKSWDYPLLILNLATSLQIPSLVVLTQSPLTQKFEQSPEKAWEHLKPIIAQLANCDINTIPKPKNQIVSSWTRDPYQRGSYTACHPGDDPMQLIISLEQGFGNVRFAGEHSILEGAGCVHGAWNSGIREANYIIKALDVISPKV